MASDEHPAPADVDRFRQLSPREREVLGLIAEGLSNSEIADRLFVTIHAVKYHVSSIYATLEVANRTEAAVLFLKLQGALNGEAGD